MLIAIGLMSLGMESGTPLTHSSRSDNDISQTLSRDSPLIRGARASSESLVPLQQGHTPILRNFSTLFIPFSSLTFERAFSTVYTALKYVKSISPALPDFSL